MILYSYVQKFTPIIIKQLRELFKIYSLTIKNSKSGIMQIKFRNNIKTSL